MKERLLRSTLLTLVLAGCYTTPLEPREIKPWTYEEFTDRVSGQEKSMARSRLSLNSSTSRISYAGIYCLHGEENKLGFELNPANPVGDPRETINVSLYFEDSKEVIEFNMLMNPFFYHNANALFSDESGPTMRLIDLLETNETMTIQMVNKELSSIFDVNLLGAGDAIEQVMAKCR